MKKYTKEQIEIFKEKANKWDALDKKISKFYNEEDDEVNDGDLCDIGEIAAQAFCYL